MIKRTCFFIFPNTLDDMDHKKMVKREQKENSFCEIHPPQKVVQHFCVAPFIVPWVTLFGQG